MPKVDLTKKSVIGGAQSKAKQFTLWEEHEKLAKVTPSAVSYNQDDSKVKTNRFKGIGMGYDVKSNAKMIKRSPGPGDYETINSGDTAVNKSTFNFKLSRGGIEAKQTCTEIKEEYIAKSLLGS